MTTLAEQDYATVVAALRSVLERDPDAIGRPGRLRLRLEEQLGPQEARRLRRPVHQVVAAAEEHLPVGLTRIAPLTAQSLQRLSGELAESRSWSPDVARRVTQAWATALGFEQLATSWPGDTTQRPPAGHLTAPPPTALPPMAAPRSAAQTAADIPWPPAPRRFATVTHGRSGQPALGVARGYAGLPLVLVTTLVILLTVGLCVPILFLGATGLLLPAVGALAGGALARSLRRGVLVATDTGLEFTTDGASRSHPDQVTSAPWSAVQVREGLVSRVDLADRSIQVGPRQRAFARAVAQHTGRER